MFFDLYHLPNETPEQYEARYQERLAKHYEWLADAPKREAMERERIALLKAEFGALTTDELIRTLCEYVDNAQDIDGDADFVTAILRERIGATP